jgi:2'-5' RNA ligase
MNSSTLRTFFACEISNENLLKIDRVLNGLQKEFPQSVKWVTVQNMHLTIQFLGEFRKSDLPQAQDQLQRALSPMKLFDLHIQKMGAFPSPTRPKVIWLGIDRQPLLFDLVKIVTQTTEQLGYAPEDRPFSAHITLGRVKPDAKPHELNAIREKIQAMMDIDIGSQQVDGLHFIKSTLTPAGPRYEELFNIPFIG